jgi:hypothetical protein
MYLITFDISICSKHVHSSRCVIQFLPLHTTVSLSLFQHPRCSEETYKVYLPPFCWCDTNANIIPQPTTLQIKIAPTPWQQTGVVDKEFYLLVMSAFVVSKCTPLNQLPARCPPRMGQLDGLDMTARIFSLRRTSHYGNGERRRRPVSTPTAKYRCRRRRLHSRQPTKLAVGVELPSA